MRERLEWLFRNEPLARGLAHYVSGILIGNQACAGCLAPDHHLVCGRKTGQTGCLEATPQFPHAGRRAKELHRGLNAGRAGAVWNES